MEGASFWVGVAQAFPMKLLATLLAITWLVKLAEESGAVAQIAGSLERRLTQWPRAVPLLAFVAAALLSGMGLGNIAATALLAPPFLALARQLGLSPFLMTLLLVGGANAPALSPWSLTGLVVRHGVSRYPESAAQAATGPWAFALTFVAVALAHGLGFFLLGGRAWLARARLRPAPRSEAIARQAAPWSLAQKRMLWILALFLMLTWILGSAGWGAGLSLALAVALRVGDAKLAWRRVPWALLALIGAVSMGAALVERHFGFASITSLAQSADSPLTVLLWLSAATSLLSIFSSSSGVVLPLMLPLLPALSLAHPSLSIEGLLVAVVVSSHLVDCSPLSSLGALCIASVREAKESSRLFRQLLIWGFVMLPVALVLCWAGRLLIEPLLFPS